MYPSVPTSEQASNGASKTPTESQHLPWGAPSAGVCVESVDSEVPDDVFFDYVDRVRRVRISFGDTGSHGPCCWFYHLKCPFWHQAHTSGLCLPTQSSSCRECRSMEEYGEYLAGCDSPSAREVTRCESEDGDGKRLSRRKSLTEGRVNMSSGLSFRTRRRSLSGWYSWYFKRIFVKMKYSFDLIIFD